MDVCTWNVSTKFASTVRKKKKTRLEGGGWVPTPSSRCPVIARLLGTGPTSLNADGISMEAAPRKTAPAVCLMRDAL
jgi:hypothetical protein